MLDVGSGSGIPGIALSILHPDKHLVIVEANSKKINFLSGVVKTLALPHVQLLNERAECISAMYKNYFDLATDDPDKLLFQTRFSVCENSVGVYAEVTSRTVVDYNDAHQQLSFEVAYRQGQVSDPYNELTAIVTQNGREDNAVVVTKPLMVQAGKVTYDHNQQLIFPAGNEYRRFETVNMHVLNMGVESIQYFEPYYHATLITDEPRVNSQYLYDKTQFGHFTVRNAEADDSFIESEYVVTHFSLFTGEPLTGGNLFVQGGFTEGVPASQLLMHYDESTGCYLLDVLLKQGAYNYQYLWVPDGSGVGQTWKIEGDKYQTVNEYLIKVYDRPFGERYDHFVGFGIVYSGR
ncbi:MAG: DUF5103 domain-containing protein [Muribaculaceae bacterium]|nr:DUF5103 domain-containing protein [Muribaculaceae bacterium]